MKKIILSLILLTISIYNIQAQTEEGDSLMTEKLRFFDITANRIFPINTYKTNLDRNLWGVGINYLWQTNREKLDLLGIEFNYAHIGSVSNTFNNASERTGSNQMSLHFVYRHFPDFYFWKIEPFFEAALGPQIFYTVTSINFFDDDSNDVQFEDSDLGLSYGLNAGFTLHVYGQIFFITKFGYFGGTSITYNVDRSNDQVVPLDNFRPETTQTNHLRWSFGAAFSF